MAESKGRIAAGAGALMLGLAVGVAVLGPDPGGASDEKGERATPRQLTVHLDDSADPPPPIADPREEEADAVAEALPEADWGAPEPRPDLTGTWCITTATSASGKPASLQATEQWTRDPDSPDRYLRRGRVAVSFDGVDWARVDYDGTLEFRGADACVAHGTSTWTASDDPGRAERAESFEFAELTMRRYYAGEGFAAGACQPLVRLDENTLTVRRGDGFGHWLRCLEEK